MSDAPQRDALTVLDLVGVVIVVLTVAASLYMVFVVPSFTHLFEGMDATLPLLTRVALLRWPLVLPGLVASGFATAGIAGFGAGIGRRRLALVLAFGIAVAGIAATFWALYLPLLQLSGAIR